MHVPNEQVYARKQTPRECHLLDRLRTFIHDTINLLEDHLRKQVTRTDFFQDFDQRFPGFSFLKELSGETLQSEELTQSERLLTLVCNSFDKSVSDLSTLERTQLYKLVCFCLTLTQSEELIHRGLKFLEDVLNSISEDDLSSTDQTFTVNLLSGTVGLINVKGLKRVETVKLVSSVLYKCEKASKRSDAKCESNCATQADVASEVVASTYVLFITCCLEKLPEVFKKHAAYFRSVLHFVNSQNLCDADEHFRLFLAAIRARHPAVLGNSTVLEEVLCLKPDRFLPLLTDLSEEQALEILRLLIKMNPLQTEQASETIISVSRALLPKIRNHFERSKLFLLILTNLQLNHNVLNAASEIVSEMQGFEDVANEKEPALALFKLALRTVVFGSRMHNTEIARITDFLASLLKGHGDLKKKPGNVFLEFIPSGEAVCAELLDQVEENAVKFFKALTKSLAREPDKQFRGSVAFLLVSCFAWFVQKIALQENRPDRLTFLWSSYVEIGKEIFSQFVYPWLNYTESLIFTLALFNWSEKFSQHVLANGNVSTVSDVCETELVYLLRLYPLDSIDEESFDLHPFVIYEAFKGFIRTISSQSLAEFPGFLLEFPHKFPISSFGHLEPYQILHLLAELVKCSQLVPQRRLGTVFGTITIFKEILDSPHIRKPKSINRNTLRKLGLVLAGLRANCGDLAFCDPLLSKIINYFADATFEDDSISSNVTDLTHEIIAGIYLLSEIVSRSDTFGKETGQPGLVESYKKLIENNIERLTQHHENGYPGEDINLLLDARLLDFFSMVMLKFDHLPESSRKSFVSLALWYIFEVPENHLLFNLLFGRPKKHFWESQDAETYEIQRLDLALTIQEYEHLCAFFDFALSENAEVCYESFGEDYPFEFLNFSSRLLLAGTLSRFVRSPNIETRAKQVATRILKLISTNNFLGGLDYKEKTHWQYMIQLLFFYEVLKTLSLDDEAKSLAQQISPLLRKFIHEAQNFNLDNLPHDNEHGKLVRIFAFILRISQIDIHLPDDQPRIQDFFVYIQSHCQKLTKTTRRTELEAIVNEQLKQDSTLSDYQVEIIAGKVVDYVFPVDFSISVTNEATGEKIIEIVLEIDGGAHTDFSRLTDRLRDEYFANKLRIPTYRLPVRSHNRMQPRERLQLHAQEIVKAVRDHLQSLP